MNLSYKIPNVKDLQKKINNLTAEVLKSQVGAVQDATFLIHSLAVKSIQDNSSGSTQTRYKPKRNVKASAPGDPPNTDKGRLVQSIKFDFKKEGLVGRVGSNLKYAKWLEFGTKRMAARPWLSTAVRVASKDVAKIFKEAFKKSTKKASKK